MLQIHRDPAEPPGISRAWQGRCLPLQIPFPALPVDSQPRPHALYALSGKVQETLLIVFLVLPTIWQKVNTGIDPTPQGKSEQPRKSYPQKREAIFNFILPSLMFCMKSRLHLTRQLPFWEKKKIRWGSWNNKRLIDWLADSSIHPSLHSSWKYYCTSIMCQTLC